MAITPTLLQDAVLLVQNGDAVNDFEKRWSQHGALQAHIENAQGLLSVDQVENMKKSVVQAEKVAVLNRFTPSIITDPSCSITGNRPTSAFMSLTWAFVGFEATIIPSQNKANYISEEQDLAWQLAGGWRTLFNSLDTSGVSNLETNKSTNLVTSNLKDVTTNASDYTFGGRDIELFMDVPSLMEINEISGAYEDVANTEAKSSRVRLDAFGANNYYDANGAVARNGDFRHFFTNRITVPDGSRELHYVMPKNAVGIYNWVDPDSQAGYQAGNKKWDMITDPMYGFDWGVYTIDDCTDDTSVSGNKRAYSMKYQIGAYFCFLTQYKSSTESPIIKILRNDEA